MSRQSSPGIPTLRSLFPPPLPDCLISLTRLQSELSVKVTPWTGTALSVAYAFWRGQGLHHHGAQGWALRMGLPAVCRQMSCSLLHTHAEPQKGTPLATMSTCLCHPPVPVVPSSNRGTCLNPGCYTSDPAPNRFEKKKSHNKCLGLCTHVRYPG